MKILKIFIKQRSQNHLIHILKVSTVMPDEQLSFNKWTTYISAQVTCNLKTKNNNK